MTEQVGTDVRTALPDPAADPAGYVLAVADLRERRAKVATESPYIVHSSLSGLAKVYSATAEPGMQRVAITGTDEQASLDAEHIAAEANPAHALAEVALWRGVAQRHDPVPGLEPLECGVCGERYTGQLWPCPDLLAVVAAAKAYAGSPS
jgi:hypothetical protein